MMRFTIALVAHGLGLAAVSVGGRAALAADPTTLECLTSYEDSLALKNHHQLVAARARLLSCSSASCPAEVRAECVRRGRDVEAAMPTVVFEVKDAAGASLVDVTVTVDGDRLAEHLDGSALSVDPGAHTFVFEAAGQPSVQRQLVMSEGQKDRRERVMFAAAGGPVVPVAPPPEARLAAAPPAASNRLEASLQAGPAKTPGRPPSPAYARWWFWTTIGVAAAGGVATALILSSGSGTPRVSSPLGTMKALPEAPP
jgi:hypothetical protein